MSEEQEPAWSDQADAVYVATVAAMDDMKGGYGERMNLLLNLTRYVVSMEVADTIMRETKTKAHVTFVEIGIITEGMQYLVDEFAGELRAMPKRMEAIAHAENGCGGCSACKAAREEAYGDGKVVMRPSREARQAVEGLINTITGAKPSN